MKSIAMIPARYAASRFPGKLMKILGNKTIIRHTYDNVLNTRLFDEVVVVTDSEVIFKEIVENGGYAVMSRQTHESGSDRIAEAARDIDADIILNVQGDEPFIDAHSLKRLLQAFEGPGNNVQVASLMKTITDHRLLGNPNCVKVVVDRLMNSLFFSRSVLPYPRNPGTAITHYQHIGVYAFRKAALLCFTQWPVTPLENAEKIECLRYLEHGLPLKMVLTDHIGISIDTPEDFDRAMAHYQANT